jgi:hypothetical protein
MPRAGALVVLGITGDLPCKKAACEGCGGMRGHVADIVERPLGALICAA